MIDLQQYYVVEAVYLNEVIVLVLWLPEWRYDKDSTQCSL